VNWQSRVPVSYRWARRIAVALVGGTVLLIGVALIVLPGPAFVVIPLGLAILGAEFAWARHWLRRIRQQTDEVVSMINGWRR
jgi:tellurite resistance protein TerC